MKSLTDVVSGAGLAGYAEIALLIFLLVFISVGLRVLFANARTFSDEARLPLEDGTEASSSRAAKHTHQSSRDPRESRDAVRGPYADR